MTRRKGWQGRGRGGSERDRRTGRGSGAKTEDKYAWKK